jgi:uncharacterized protein YggU (UPF0235/DUF167 family)
MPSYTLYVYIKVLVHAGAKREKVRRISLTKFEVSVTEPAERNLANRRVLSIIAEANNVGVGKVKIISGHHSPSKMLVVDA